MNVDNTNLDIEKEMILSGYEQSELEYFREVLEQSNSYLTCENVIIEIKTEVGTDGEP